MDNIEEFVEDMHALSEVANDFPEALFFAMENVTRYDDDKGIRYFGAVGHGTFYADGSFENTRWYPDTSPQEALTQLWLEFGEEFTEGLQLCWS